jgi:hypothetical protein
MNCARCEELLFARLDGAAIDAEREALHAHLRTCARCRDLDGLLREPAEGGLTRLEIPDELVPAVLERTSQPVSRALVRLGAELPELAELDLDEAFVAEVMAATVGARRATHAPLVARMRAVWQRLAQRPRFALEGAYAAVLVAFLIFGLPSPSLAELPGRAFDGVRQEAVRVERAVSSRVDALVGFGVASWSESSTRAAEYLDRRTADPAGRLDDDLRTHATEAGELAAAIWQRLFAPFFDNLRAAWHALFEHEAVTDRQG